MPNEEVTTLVDGLVFPECPRWRTGTLWFSDVLDQRVMQMSEGGQVTLVAVVDHPAGLGWLPDGRLLVVSMQDRRLLVGGGPRLAELADLSALAEHDCNDMVVDRAGRAYVGHVGRPQAGSAVADGDLILVEAGAAPRVVATGLRYPNGCAVTPDGRRLVLAEFDGDRLLAFDIGGDGSLSDPEVVAELGSHPDGICLDAEGSVWVALPRSEEVVRVREDGRVVDRIAAGRPVYAVALGGGDGRTLFLCTAAASSAGVDQLIESRSGRIEAVRVAIPGVSAP